MKVKLEFNDVNTEEEERMSEFLVSVIDGILKEDKVKTCIIITHNVYEDFADRLNCTNRKKFDDIFKLLFKLDDLERDK